MAWYTSDYRRKPVSKENNLVGGRTAAVLSSQGFLCQNPDPNFFEARVV